MSPGEKGAFPLPARGPRERSFEDDFDAYKVGPSRPRPCALPNSPMNPALAACKIGEGVWGPSLKLAALLRRHGRPIHLSESPPPYPFPVLSLDLEGADTGSQRGRRTWKGYYYMEMERGGLRVGRGVGRGWAKNQCSQPPPSNFHT